MAQITLGGNTVIFDPSYGKLYQGATDADRLLALQKGAIDFFGLTINETKRDGTFHMLLRPAPTDTLQLISKAKPYGGTK